MYKLADIKKEFYTNHYYEIDEDVSDISTGVRVEYIPALNIFMKTDLIFEGDCYDETIQCQPILYKANNIDEAWEKARGYIFEALPLYDESDKTFYEEDEYKEKKRLEGLKDLLKNI